MGLFGLVEILPRGILTGTTRVWLARDGWESGDFKLRLLL